MSTSDHIDYRSFNCQTFGGPIAHRFLSSAVFIHSFIYFIIKIVQE